MNYLELNNALVRYLQLCEAFRISNIWSKDSMEAIQYFLDYKVYMDNPINDLYKPLFRAGEILNGIKEGKFRVLEKHTEIHGIADEVWYAFNQSSYVRDNTSAKEVKVDKEVVESLVNCFGRGETTKINKYFLLYISGRIWEELGG